MLATRVDVCLVMLVAATAGCYVSEPMARPHAVGEACAVDAQCLPGLGCDAGVCQTRCAHSDTCSAGHRCQEGYCVVSRRSVTGELGAAPSAVRGVRYSVVGGLGPGARSVLLGSRYRVELQGPQIGTR